MLNEAAESRPRFWYISESDAPFRSVEVAGDGNSDLRYQVFGRPVGKNWQPPQYRIVGNGRWPDWMRFSIPLLSKAGISAIGRLISPCCEILPWIKERRHEYALVNVFTRIPRVNWLSEEFTAYGGVLASADNISIHGVEIPPIFWLEGFSGHYYVSDAVARASVDAGLTGAVFVDPRIKKIHIPFIQGQRNIYGGFISLEHDL